MNSTNVNFKNKVILITGSSRGIGKKIAYYFAHQKAHVVINYSKSQKEAEKTFQLVKKISPDSLLVKADISQKDQVENMINKINKKFGRIDILINNAGAVYKPTKWDQITPDSWNQTLNINLTGTFNCIQTVAPTMIKQKFGKIINISSTASICPSTDALAYSVAKSGINSLTNAFAKELAPFINVNSVAPGWTDTSWHKDKDSQFTKMIQKVVPFRRLAQIQEIVEAVSFLASDKSNFITGQILVLDGGLTLK